MAAIRLRGLSKSYGARVGVAALDLDVPEGIVLGFIGPNGAGKTTTIRLLLGFLRADAGTAIVLGHDCATHSRAIKRQVGYVPGDLRLHEWMTGVDALTVNGRARGLDLRAAGASLARAFELDLDVRVRAMSRGMRQKLGLILALAHAPRLLILDEPTTALDPITRSVLASTLRERARGGVTVFFSSHVLSEVEDLCERVAVIRRGRLVADESMAALRATAPRQVRIRWRRGAGARPDAVPEHLAVRERRGDEWTAELCGPAADLVEWLHGEPIDDLVIAEPDLDSLFRRYYVDDEGGRAP